MPDRGGVGRSPAEDMLEARILVVDDEASVRKTLANYLRRAGHQVRVASDADEALAVIDEFDVQVMVTDIAMPGISGMSLLEMLHDQRPEIKAVLMTGQPSFETATRAVRARAFDYLEKPFRLETVKSIIEKAVQFRELEDADRALREHHEEREAVVQRERQELHARLEDLAGQRARLIEISRQSGMREVASHLMHSAGNALCAVSASVANIDRMRPSHARQCLELLADMLAPRSGVLATTLGEERGRQLPEFLRTLARNLAHIESGIGGELGHIMETIESVRATLGSECDDGPLPSLAQTCDVRRLVERAMAGKAAVIALANLRAECTCLDDVAHRDVETDPHGLVAVIEAMIVAACAHGEASLPGQNLTVALSRPREAEHQIEVFTDACGNADQGGVVESERVDLRAIRTACARLGAQFALVRVHEERTPRLTLTLPTRVERERLEPARGAASGDGLGN